MEMVLESRKDIRNLFVYFVIFYLTWIIRVIYIGPLFIEKFSSNFVFHALLNEGVRVTVWIIPVFLFLKYVDSVRPTSFLKLNKDIVKKIMTGILVGIIFLVWVFLRDYYIMHKHVNFYIGIGRWMTVLVVGFAEEISFRGFLLQKIEGITGFWKANCISALMFMLAHYPSYIYHMNKNMFVEGITVFIMGLIFGYLLKRTKSLWPSIISHSIYDLGCYIV